MGCGYVSFPVFGIDVTEQIRLVNLFLFPKFKFSVSFNWNYVLYHSPVTAIFWIQLTDITTQFDINFLENNAWEFTYGATYRKKWDVSNGIYLVIVPIINCMVLEGD